MKSTNKKFVFSIISEKIFSFKKKIVQIIYFSQSFNFQNEKSMNIQYRNKCKGPFIIIIIKKLKEFKIHRISRYNSYSFFSLSSNSAVFNFFFFAVFGNKKTNFNEQTFSRVWNFVHISSLVFSRNRIEIKH